MENLTPGEILAILAGALLALAGAITTIGNAVEKVIKAIKAAKAPNENQNKRLDDHETRIKTLEGYAAQDKKHLDSLDEGNRVTLQALLALLDHGIDGNNIKQMEEAKADVQHHLINR